MALTVFGRILETADLSGLTQYHRFTPTDDIVLKAIRTTVIQYANPTYTSISMKLYSDNSSSTPGALIATSTNSVLKATIDEGVASSLAEIYFEFNEIVLKSGTYYHFVLAGSGYTGSASSHLAWKHGGYNPVYETGLTLTTEKLGISPFDLVVIGDGL